jgi:HEAT repeats
MRESIIKPAVRKVLLCWLAILCAILVYMVASMDRSRAQQLEQQQQQDQATAPIALPGKPAPPDHSKLSEHNVLWLKTQPAQEQMEFLLGAAINHDRGATDLIAKYSESWSGKLKRTQRWQDLETTALYSNDLRVRAAAIEINLIVNSLEKTDDTASRLMEAAEQEPSSRSWYEWELGMLASRGVQPDRIHEWLAASLHDKDQQVRFWAVEGLAHIGSDDTIKNFLDVLRNDPSMEVRERAGCSLAKSGMLTREQRMKAVPGLLELTDDPALNATTRSWVYQALREITDESLPNDPAAWRNWYSRSGTKKIEQFRQGESWALLGNN